MTDDERREAEQWVAKEVCFDGLEYPIGGETFKDCVRAYAAGRESMRSNNLYLQKNYADKVDDWRIAIKKLEAERARSERYAELLRDVLDLTQIADGHPRGIKALIREALK